MTGLRECLEEIQSGNWAIERLRDSSALKTTGPDWMISSSSLAEKVRESHLDLVGRLVIKGVLSIDDAITILDK